MGAVLAIDFGTKRLGIAVTDRDRRFVFPRDTIQRTDPAADTEALRRVAEDEHAELVVIGLPLNADGSEGGMVAAVRAFGNAVSAALGLPVTFVDERYTTIEAEERLRERFPRDTRKRRSLRDRAAATLILKTYLEHGPA